LMMRTLIKENQGIWAYRRSRYHRRKLVRLIMKVQVMRTRPSLKYLKKWSWVNIGASPSHPWKISLIKLMARWKNHFTRVNKSLLQNHQPEQSVSKTSSTFALWLPVYNASFRLMKWQHILSKKNTSRIANQRKISNSAKLTMMS